MATPNTPDAAESNAGDNFHILWAMRKSLKLLNFSPDGMKALTVEGVTKADEEILKREAILGVDLTEYFGGKEFKTASVVVISQLKYSTRNQTKNWTPSELCSGKKHAWKESILHKLAKVFQGFYDKHPKTQTMKKLQVKLVSNRPVSLAITKTINAAKDNIKANTKRHSISTITKGMIAADKAVTKRLLLSSGLTSEVFADFLQLLNFSDCGTLSRFGQDQKLIEAIGEAGSMDPRNAYRKLYELILDRTLPEGQARNTISLSDIVLTFGFPDISDLFPARSSMHFPPVVIPREQVTEIVRLVRQPDKELLVLHGGAGIGKSIITEQIRQQINPHSCVLVYDCYGSGSYLDSDDQRHKPANAFLQLSNELALRCGTPFLLTRDLRTDLFLKEFQRRLALAAQVLQKANAGAQVVIIIDAADNSVYGAEQSHELSFVQDLLRMQVPEGCRIIVTLRTERLTLLQLPEYYTDLPIRGFSLPETKSLLQASFPETTDAEVAEFHELTNATPRMMAYALKVRGKALATKLKPLKPDGGTIDTIFKAMVTETMRRFGDAAAVKKFLTYLIYLPRPVPMGYMRELAGLSDTALADLRTDLWEGIVFTNDSFSFRDEDFENFLRNSYPRTESVNKAIAEAFLAAASSEGYASTHLGTALSNAGMYKELQTIVLERKFRDYPEDPIKNKDVEVERTRLAMKLSHEEKNYLNLLKLQTVAAQAAKTNSVLEDILLANAELAASYGNIQMNQRLYFQAGNPAWFGPVHFRNAAVYSRTQNTHELAIQHLDKAIDWMNYGMRLTKNEQEEFQIGPQDLAYGVEAILRIKGPNRAIKWLQQWRSKEFVYSVIELLLYKIIDIKTGTLIQPWLKALGYTPELRLLVNRVCYERQSKPAFTVKELSWSLKSFKKEVAPKNKGQLKDIISLCEHCLAGGAKYTAIHPWLTLINIPVPQHIPVFNDNYPYGGLSEEKHTMDVLFRKAVIIALFEKKALKPADFYPATVKDGIAKTDYTARQYPEEQQRKFDSIYRHLIPIYQLRLLYILNAHTPAKLRNHFKTILQFFEKDYEISYLHGYDYVYIVKFMAVKLADIVVYRKDEQVIEEISAAFKGREKAHNITLYLALAAKFCFTQHYHPAVLKLLGQAEAAIDQATLQQSEQLTYFTKAAITASQVSSQAGKHYFDKMVHTSAEIDAEGQQQIKAYHSLVATEKEWHDPRLAYEFARFIEYCHESLGNGDHFPWEKGIETVARLDPASVFSTACRWDHRNTRKISDDFTLLLKECLGQGFISHIQAASLLPINPYTWPGLMTLVSDIFKGFDYASDYKGKDNFVRAVSKQLRLDFTPMSDIKVLDLFGDLIADGRFISREAVEEFNTFHQFVRAQLTSRPSPEKESSYRSSNTKNTRLEKAVRSLDITSAEDITKLLQKLKVPSSNVYIDFEDLSSLMRERARPEQYIAHLDAIAALDPDLTSFYSYERGLQATLQAWEIFPEIKAWKKRAFAPFLKDKLSYFIYSNYANLEGLEKTAGLFDIDRTGLAMVLLQLVPEALDELDASVLYQLMEITTAVLQPDEKKQLARWIMPRWNAKIKDSLGDGPWQEKFRPPMESNMVMAHLLRYLLGHPAKALRWRAAHSLRRMASFGSNPVFTHLLQLQNQNHCGSFQDGSLQFYWLSAKLYLWIALDRIAKENGSALKEYTHAYLTVLNDKALPHLLVMKFAKSTCLTLAASDKTVFNTAEMLVIEKAVAPTTRRKGKRTHTGTRATKNPGKTTFHFDSLDTIPYWYQPLARILDLPVDSLLEKVDDFITNRWGYRENGREGDPAFAYNWNKTSHRHGSESDVENLRSYFEFHAMFCAAGILFPTASILSDPDEDESPAEWLGRWLTCWDDNWLADLRDPIPFLPELWQIRRPDDWLWQVGIKDFDILSGLGLDSDSDLLPIKTRIRMQYDSAYENLTVMTALADPRYARSLLASLQTAKRLSPFIPLEKEDEDSTYWDDTWKKKGPRFQLKGWIQSLESHREGIDNSDSQYRCITKSRLAVSGCFKKWAKLQFTDDMRFSYQGSDPADWVTKLECWGKDGKDDRPRSDNEFSSEGERLCIRKDILLHFLKEANQCLLVNTEIERHVDRRGHHYEYYDPYCYIYLIYPDGKIETINGTYRLGKKDRK